MTVLHSDDFFSAGQGAIAIEPRAPQPAFPEHHHDFYEIVLVDQGTGTHIFNGQPYTLSTGSVCFVRNGDRHLYEHTENLCLTNILFRSPDSFQFLAGLEHLLPQMQGDQYPSHWRVNTDILQQTRKIIAQLAQLPSEGGVDAQAQGEMLFMQLLLLLRQACMAEQKMGNQGQLNALMSWLEDHSAEPICWEVLADRFSVSLRTLHRQVKQNTGLSPQRYLNRIRLVKASHLLRHSDESVTNIAYQCGFGDSNHFSTMFKREFSYSPREVRHGRNISQFP